MNRERYGQPRPETAYETKRRAEIQKMIDAANQREQHARQARREAARRRELRDLMQPGHGR